MKVLVSGSAGMLAKDLIPCLTAAGHQVIAPPEEQLDILDLDGTRTAVDGFHPDIIINCAAYTKVDDAEKEEHLANMINGFAVQNLCLTCQEAAIPLVHFSTDYVFDGTKEGGYTIYDQPNPIGAYGRSKLIGEKYVLWLLDRFYLIRTSWLFGLHGRNFIETMLKLAEKQRQVSVVNDQTGCPTWTRDLAAAVTALIATGRYGLYHITNCEPTTWFDFATEIFRLSGTGTEVLPIATDQYPTPAKRPQNSTLDPFPLEEVVHTPMPSWKQALGEYLNLRTRRVQP